MWSQEITLWCNVKGDSVLFKVKAGIHDDISDMKKLIHHEGKNGVFSGVDAKDLVLWKVRCPPVLAYDILTCVDSLLFKYAVSPRPLALSVLKRSIFPIT